MKYVHHVARITVRNTKQISVVKPEENNLEILGTDAGIE